MLDLVQNYIPLSLLCVSLLCVYLLCVSLLCVSLLCQPGSLSKTWLGSEWHFGKLGTYTVKSLTLRSRSGVVKSQDQNATTSIAKLYRFKAQHRHLPRGRLCGDK